MANLFVLPFRPAFDNNAKIIPGAQLWFTLTETDVAANVYSDEGLTTPMANPVVANAVGRFPTIWLDESVTYRARMYDADAIPGSDTPIEEYDPYDTGMIIENANTLITVTPYDFGASGMNIVSDPAANITDQASLDASPDDADALQAFFDDMRQPENAHKVYDWSGHWATSKPLYAVLPLVNTGQLNVEYHGRRMICGTLHVLPVASQPGATMMANVLTISGPYSDMQGHLMIHAGDRGTSNYADRRFVNGVRFIQCAEARIEKITVVSAQDKPFWIDSQFETWDETDIGAPYAVGSTSKNNIGLQIGHAYAVNCGSCNQFGTSSGRSYNLTVSAKAQGGDPLSNGVFENATPSVYNSSGVQRTRLTVSTTAKILAGHFGRMRMEIPTATFTTIAADNTAGTLTWAAGDPVAAGLDVGQKITLEDGGAVGANDGTVFTIVGFGGTSNRTITVYPKPTTEAAKAYTNVFGEWSLHRVMTVLSGTQFMVYPWVPDGANSKWYHISGMPTTSGNDAANVQFGFLGAIWCGGGLYSMGLYGTLCQNFLTDHCDIGVALGGDINGSAIGVDILHSHIEGTEWTAAQVALTTSFFIRGGSVFDRTTAISLQPRGTTDAALQLRYGLISSGIAFQGEHITSQADYSSAGLAAGNITVTNSPSSNDRTVGVNTVTITLDYDDFALKQGYAQARVLWQGTTTPAPTGTATLALSTQLTGLGWTMTGATSVTAPSGSILFRIVYDRANKRVWVTQVSLLPSQVGFTGPWTGYSGVSFVDRGGDEFEITKTSADAWQGQAWFRIDDDYRLRIQPLQTSSLMAIGLDNAGALTADNGTMDAFLYFLTGPAQYQPYKTAYTADTASSPASYSANDYFWLERRGSVLRFFTGGPTFATAVLVWTHTVDVSGSDYAKLLIRDSGAAMRVKLFPIPEEPRVVAVTSSATVTPTFNDDLVKITAQAAGLTLANPTGTAIPGRGLAIRIKDNGTARSIAYGSEYRAIGVTLPTTTVVSKTLYLGMIFNSDDTKWDVVSVAQEA